MLNNILKISGIVVLALVLFVGGMALGAMVSGGAAVTQRVRPAAQPNIIVMPPAFQGGGEFNTPRGGMGGRFFGPGNGAWNNDEVPFGRGGMMGPNFGYGGQFGRGFAPDAGDQDRVFAYGMMGGYTPDESLVPADGETLTLENAAKVAEACFADSGYDNLKLAEVMQFENHFYAAFVDDGGRGALEILIDPRTAAAFPEPGPNMMWNLRYGMMGGRGGMMAGRGGMMGGVIASDDGETMSVDLDEAKAFAIKELEALEPDAEIEGDGLAFYGYYTFDYAVDGKIVGMLSVNGYTGEVWLHTWHGAFVAEQEAE